MKTSTKYNVTIFKAYFYHIFNHKFTSRVQYYGNKFFCGENLPKDDSLGAFFLMFLLLCIQCE